MIVPNIPHIPLIMPRRVTESYDFSNQDVTFIGITVLLFTIMFCLCISFEYHHSTFSEQGFLVQLLTIILIIVLSHIIGYFITYLIF